MGKASIRTLIASIFLCADFGYSQKVAIAHISLGMNEAEVKTALAARPPSYVTESSEFVELHYLVAESQEESFAFTFLDGRVVAFSLMHILPAGQQSFLPPGQQPSVGMLRNLIIQRTWQPAAIDRGDTWWFSDAAGAPLADPSKCNSESAGWLPFGRVPTPKPGDVAPASTEGLMKPALIPYPSECGMGIHLNETPGEDENVRVHSIRIQVLDMKTISEFVASHKQD